MSSSRTYSVPLCLKSELDHFHQVPVQTAMEHAKYISYQPVNNYLNGDTLNFEVSGSPEDAIDLAHSELLLDVCILTNAGTNPTADAKFAPVNMFARSLFSGHELHLNNEMVSSNPSMSHYGCYIETLLNYTSVAQPSLADSGWILDEADTFDNVEAAAPADNAGYTVNDGLLSRKENVLNGSVWRMFTKVPSDLSNQPLLIPPKVDLKLVLTRSKDRFALLSSDNPFNYKIEIKSAILRVRRIKLDAEFLIGHEMMLQKKNITMPYTETNVQEYSVPQGSSTWSRQDVFRGIVPKKLILSLVESKAIIGDLKLNPYNFQVGDLNQISVYVNGDPIPYKQLQIRSNNTRDGYLSLLETTGCLFKNTSLQFKSSEWAKGFGLYGFLLEPEHSDGSCTNARKRGVVEISLHFSKATTKAYSLIVFYTRDAVVEIDAHRNVFLPLKRIA